MTTLIIGISPQAMDVLFYHICQFHPANLRQMGSQIETHPTPEAILQADNT